MIGSRGAEFQYGSRGSALAHFSLAPKSAPRLPAEGGIRIQEVQRGGLFIQNCTIANCHNGITVLSVAADMARPIGTTRRNYGPSAIENNIVVDYHADGHGIQIGQGGAPGAAAEWNPFDNPLPGYTGPGNPVIPVSYNLVWRQTANGLEDSVAFTGDDWYDDEYPTPDPPYPARFGEVFANPNLDSSYRPTTASTGVLENGNPRRVDVWRNPENGQYRGMRRCLGAFEVKDCPAFQDQLAARYQYSLN